MTKTRVNIEHVRRATNNFTEDANAVYALLLSARMRQAKDLRFARKNVEISSLNFGGDTSKRKVLEIYRSLQKGSRLLPIVVDCSNRIVDGNHRTKAKLLTNKSRITAFVLTTCAKKPK